MAEGGHGPGSVIGAYEVIDELGRGGLGIVYRSRHQHLGRLAALKVLHPYWTTSPEFVERFKEEGRVMALLEHPNILRVYDAGECEGAFYLAMSFLEGHTLESLLRAPLPPRVAVEIAKQLARALAYAHSQGVVHRDVKPANVMVSPRGDVTLMDFGVARLRDAPGLTLPGVRIGTPYYMAPEQILGRKADQRSDLYALGVVLHQMLSGHLPFPGPDTEEVYEGHVHREPPPLDHGVPPWLQDLVARALAKKPDERFQDAETLLRALESSGKGITAPQPIRPSPVARTVASYETAQVAPAAPAQETSLVREDRAVLALDVVQSSRMKHPGLTLTVQQHFAAFREFVAGHLQTHGCLASAWAGDGLIALFPKASDGAGCAAAILDGLAEFNNARSYGQMDPIRLRIGVHHGPVVMAPGQNLGEVVSRTFDTAGHLQKSSPEDSALVSETVYLSLPNVEQWSPAGDEYLLLFPFRVYRCRPGGASVAAPPEPSLTGAWTSRVLRLTVSIGLFRTDYEVKSEVILGRPDPVTGKVPEIDLRADDAISRRHARIYPGLAGFYLEDLDSANGTRVNEEWARPGFPVLLRPGDLIELGRGTSVRVEGIEG